MAFSSVTYVAEATVSLSGYWFFNYPALQALSTLKPWVIIILQRPFVCKDKGRLSLYICLLSVVFPLKHLQQVDKFVQSFHCSVWEVSILFTFLLLKRMESRPFYVE